MADVYNTKAISIRDFRVTLETLLPNFPKPVIFNCLKLIDIDKNDIIEQREFEMMFLDENSIQEKMNQSQKLLS